MYSRSGCAHALSPEVIAERGLRRAVCGVRDGRRFTPSLYQSERHDYPVRPYGFFRHGLCYAATEILGTCLLTPCQEVALNL